MSSPRKALGAAQARVLRAVGPVLQGRGFYLAGGTALALQLGHRRSLDLDWFTALPFDDANALASGLRAEGIDFRKEAVGRGTLHGSVAGTRVSLLAFPYPMLGATRPCCVGACEMASLDDLAAMKLSAVAQRGSRKDFVDIYALIVRHASLERMLDGYRRKFSMRETGHAVYALTYFDDAEKEPMPEMLWDVPWRVIKRAIAKEVRKL